ncbi:hypothetical protein GJU43_12550 [Flavobacterium sp. LC2016-23]|uniref:hypothetical protein n=1 Tax=Flavobacterium sp. LC2016-23 TaxID=2666330 RepID=UPI0012B04763|nr:hypothetical protein [Flavobacterium sp. LC2016-23]MRX40109.1 hypothetical protein [Flavobacterium sp. LC2016-23]
MKNYTYIEKVSFIRSIIGNLLFIPSFLALIFINFRYGPILFLFYLFIAYWGIFFISTEGLEFDFQNKKHRKLFSVYGINFGLSWNYFQDLKYIALVETFVKQTFGGRGFGATATTTVSEKTVKINLFDQNDKYQTLYFANNRIEALKIATEIKNTYQIEVVTNF